MALTEWGFNGLPPQWSLQSPGCIQWSWPIKMSKNDKINTFNIIYHKSVNNWLNGIEIHSRLLIWS